VTAVSASALTYPVAALLAEPAGSRRDYAFDGLWLDVGDDLELAAPVAGRVRFSRTSRGLFITGLAETTLGLTCSRCLRPIEFPLTVALSEEALPTIDLVSGKPLDPSIEPEIARLTDHHEVQLEPLIREAVQLAEPIAPVCRPDCPGLCIVCGEALDDGPHEHDDAALDPRLEVLRAFRVDAGAETD
jgi:uncharacterized protein